MLQPFRRDPNPSRLLGKLFDERDKPLQDLGGDGRLRRRVPLENPPQLTVGRLSELAQAPVWNHLARLVALNRPGRDTDQRRELLLREAALLPGACDAPADATRLYVPHRP